MHITCSRGCKERSHIYCWWVWRCLCWHPMPVKFRSRSCRRHDCLTIETTFPHHFPEFSAFCSIGSSSSLSSHSPPWMKSLCVCVRVFFFRVLGLACFLRSQRRTTNISSSNICEQNLLQPRDTREFAVSYWKQHHHGKNLELEARNDRGHEDSLSTKKNTHTHFQWTPQLLQRRTHRTQKVVKKNSQENRRRRRRRQKHVNTISKLHQKQNCKDTKWCKQKEQNQKNDPKRKRRTE